MDDGGASSMSSLSSRGTDMHNSLSKLLALFWDATNLRIIIHKKRDGELSSTTVRKNGTRVHPYKELKWQ